MTESKMNPNSPDKPILRGNRALLANSGDDYEL